MNEINFIDVSEIDAYEFGQHAYWRSQSSKLSDNPFPVGTRMRVAWAAGWADAHADAYEAVYE